MTEGGKESESPNLDGFDRIFPYIGGHHRYQWILLAVTSLGGIQAFHLMGYTFLGAVPDHWCKIDALSDVNWSTDQIKNISIPVQFTGKGKLEYEDCSYYDLNYDLIKMEPDFEKAYASINFTIVEKKECSEWMYDTSIYSLTTVSQFNLVCGRKYLAATIQATFMSGYLVGSLLEPLSDRLLGRRGFILLGSSLIIFGGFGTAFAWSYSVFLLFRFMIAVGAACSFQNRFTILMEYCDARSRAAFGFMQSGPYCFFYMLMALYGYMIRDWHHLQLAFSVTTLVLISYYWIVPESSRWLATRNREEEAVAILEKIAKINRRVIPDKVELVAILETCKDKREIGHERKDPSNNTRTTRCISGFLHILRNYAYLVKTPELRRRSFIIWTLYVSVSLVYYGISFSSPTLSSDPFIVVFFNGLVEFPAYMGIIPMATKWGRKPTVAFTFLVSGFCCIGVALIPTEMTGLRVFISMLGKLLISGCFAVIGLLCTELYPTSARTTGFGAAALIGRIGSISAPYVALMKSVYTDLPGFIYGITALFAGLVALLLPETKDADLLDQVNAVEAVAANRRRDSHDFALKTMN